MNKIGMMTRVFIVWGVLLSLSAGCGGSKTKVLAPPELAAKFTAAEIYEDRPTITVPADVGASFKEKLTQLLYGEGGFTRGDGLKISYRFVQYNPGSKSLRWVTSGIGGKGQGTLSIEVRFLDSNGRELAKIMSEGKIESGMLGGSFASAIEKAANEVAEYAKKQFR
jgi:hypothetical protein